MEIIPLVYNKKRKLRTKPDNKPIETTKLLENLNPEIPLYIKDLDGLNSNKPGLCHYQKISPQHAIWSDAGPRDQGDIMDLLFAGASKITIRTNFFPEKNIPQIKELTENQVYTTITSQKIKNNQIPSNIPPGLEGYVFIYEEQKEIDYKTKESLKSLCSKYKVYVLDEKNIKYNLWKELGATGQIREININ